MSTTATAYFPEPSEFFEKNRCFFDVSLALPPKHIVIPTHSRCSAIAQLVERSTVNRMVAGSSPARGAISFHGNQALPILVNSVTLAPSFGWLPLD